MSSLFPSLSTNPGLQPQASSLSGNQPSDQQSQSPFAKPTTTLNATTGGGFSVGSAMSAQPSQGSSLFGSLASKPPASGGALFGNTTSSQAGPMQSNAGLFGQSSNAVGTSGAQGQQESSTQTGAAAQSSEIKKHNGNSHNLLNGPLRPALFDNLLQRGKKRTANEDMSFSNLPTLNLGLSDISSKVRTLRGSQLDAQGHSNASGASLSRSVPGPSVTHKGLNRDRLASGGIAEEADIDAHVARLSAKSTKDLINESLEQSKRDFDAFLEDNIQMNWEEQRRRIYEHFGLTRPSNGVDGDRLTALQGSFGKSSRRSRLQTTSEQRNPKNSTGQMGTSRSLLGGSFGRKSTALGGSVFTDIADKKVAAGLPAVIEDPYLRTKQDKYSTKVASLNIARLKGLVYPIVEEFAQVEMSSGSDVPKHLIDSFRALKSIIKENSSAQRPSEPGAIAERQFAKDYLDVKTSSSGSASLRQRILDGSRTFLEQDFMARVEEIIAKNPREANVGGMPSNLNKVRAYVRLRAARKDLSSENVELQMLGDDHCWALIFYLIRCGLLKEAAEYIQTNERAIKSMDRNFSVYLLQYTRDPDRRLPRDLQVRIQAEYLQKSRLAPESALDPYKMACLKVIGRCDVQRRSLEGVKTSIEDFLWLTFSLAREVNKVEETASDAFGLEDVQAVVEDISQRHFGPGNETSLSYATLGFMQILTGLFESAVGWIYQHNPVTAVHLAIALDFYGLLRVSDLESSGAQLLSYTTRQKPQISFGLLLKLYVQEFQLANPSGAADYLVLIALNADLPGTAGTAQAAICHEALKDLVLETREFAQLLGDIQSDGRRIPGVIEDRIRLIDAKETTTLLQSLTVQAAAIADDNGRSTDAVLLYHLAEDYDRVMVIIARALSDSLAASPGADPVRLEPLKPRNTSSQQTSRRGNEEPTGSLSVTSMDEPTVLANSFIQLYATQGILMARVKPATREAIELLASMAEAKKLIVQGLWADALRKISQLGILPLGEDVDINTVQRQAQATNSMPPIIARNLGNLLVWTVESLGRLRHQLKGGAYVAAAREGMADELLQKARDCMMFAGLIRYKIGPDVYELLARAGNNIVNE